MYLLVRTEIYILLLIFNCALIQEIVRDYWCYYRRQETWTRHLPFVSKDTNSKFSFSCGGCSQKPTECQLGHDVNELDILQQHAHRVCRWHCSRGEQASTYNNKRRREEWQLIGLHNNAAPARLSAGTESALAALASGQNTLEEDRVEAHAQYLGFDLEAVPQDCTVNFPVKTHWGTGHWRVDAVFKEIFF